MSKKKFSVNLSGKGYYIALILCAVAIGISGYLYYRHADDREPTLQNDPTRDVSATQDSDVPVAATQPGDTTDPTAAPVPDPAKKPGRTASPVSGETVAAYSMDALSYNQTTRDWRVHNGMDIAAKAGTKVCAAADGTVYTVYEDETMGMTVVISHENGYSTHYASLADKVTVKAGDRVKLGDTIGTVGATALLETAIGDHVHFGVSCNGVAVDPQQFLSKN